MLFTLAQDATNKPLSELLELNKLDLYATAKLRERYYKELHDD